MQNNVIRDKLSAIRVVFYKRKQVFGITKTGMVMSNGYRSLYKG